MIQENSILNKNKSWKIGQLVNIGFMKSLRVLSVEAVKDGLPDIYTLESVKGVLYTFIPHNGLTRVN